MRQPTLIVMVKEPRAGQVKTRLGKDIGMTSAAWWYRHQLRRLFRNIADPRWQVLLAVTPDTAVASRTFPTDFPRMAQGPGDLGLRMANALRATPGPTLLIGSDIPAIRRHHIASAFGLLGRSPAVIGPAPDGGFWLVGLRHPGRAPRTLFRDVAWSQPKTLLQTLPTLPHPVARTKMLADVDTAEDLHT